LSSGDPTRRDRSRIRLVTHKEAPRRVPTTPAGRPRSPRVPRFVATLVGIAGILSLLSAATSPLQQRVQVLTGLVPLAVSAGATSVAALAGLGLLVVAGGLARRQRLAWWIALVLLVVGGVSHLLKDLDVPSGALNLGLAVVLVSYRREFDAKVGPGTLRRSLLTLPALLAVVWGFGIVAIMYHAKGISPHPTFSDAFVGSIRGIVGLDMHMTVTGQTGRWIPGLLPLLGVVAAVAAFATALRPVVEDLRRSPADADAANEIVREYGTDTLSYFSLRRDKSYFFDGEAFVAYRYMWNLGLVSGDPIGPPADRFGAMEAFVRHARGMGWNVAVLAGSQEMGPIYRELGLRSFYLGDEAILDPRTFSLEGRPIRKVRQSGHRMMRAGYTIDFLPDSEVGPDLHDALDGVTQAWRGRAPERGFTMCLDRLPSPQDPECITVVARDPEGRAQGYLHLVPCYGPARGYSLDQMRRRPDTPNGMTEWMVAETSLELGRRGCERFSLNFAVRGKMFDDPAGLNVIQRMEAALLRRFNPFFQIERLRDFNAKFFPVWVPRYIYYEAALSLPRVALAYLEAESLVRTPLIGAHGRLRSKGWSLRRSPAARSEGA
jgi:lysyl-tRNA synthetase, class II